jgi:hypothetical protein
MVIVHLIGGLGNQLFQYATARVLAKKLNTDLKIDNLGFEVYKKHKYSLQHFQIPQNFATAEEIQELKDQALKKDSFFSRVSRFLRGEAKTVWLREEDDDCTRFKPQILKSRGNIYLQGYWQSEKYFAAYADLIRKELMLNTPLNDEDSKVVESIYHAPNSVSLHVRRGDYVSDPGANAVHGTCTIAYYKKAIAHLEENGITNPHFFIFSDDIDWVKRELPMEHRTTFVNHNSADRNFADLHLMSACKHNIVANSSFSWWGAWLNLNPNKKVIAPAHWFASELRGNHDIIPDNWVKIQG